MIKGKSWGNKKSPMKSYNKQFRHVNWTPECITQGEEGSATLETAPWLFMQTNWKLSSNLTFDLQQCTSMYVLRKAQKSVKRKTFASNCQVVWAPSWPSWLLHIHRNSTISVHTLGMFKPQQVSQQTPRRRYSQHDQQQQQSTCRNCIEVFSCCWLLKA